METKKQESDEQEDSKVETVFLTVQKDRGSLLSKVYLIVLLIFVVIAVSLFTFFLKHGGNVNDNIIPELIGFCLDGIFFVALLNYFEKHQVRKQELYSKKQFKAALRGSLYLFLNLAYSAVPENKTNLTFTDAISSTSGIEQLINSLRQSDTISGLLETYLKDAAGRNLGIVQSLLPIAAQIDKVHLELWSMIIRDISWIGEPDQDGGTSIALDNLLHHIKVFDSLKIRV